MIDKDKDFFSIQFITLVTIRGYFFINKVSDGKIDTSIGYKKQAADNYRFPMRLFYYLRAGLVWVKRM